MLKCDCSKCDFCVASAPTTDGKFGCTAAPYNRDRHCKEAINKMIDTMKSIGKIEEDKK